MGTARDNSGGSTMQLLLESGRREVFRKEMKVMKQKRGHAKRERCEVGLRRKARYSSAFLGTPSHNLTPGLLRATA